MASKQWVIVIAIVAAVLPIVALAADNAGADDASASAVPIPHAPGSTKRKFQFPWGVPASAPAIWLFPFAPQPAPATTASHIRYFPLAPAPAPTKWHFKFPWGAAAPAPTTPPPKKWVFPFPWGAPAPAPTTPITKWFPFPWGVPAAAPAY